MGPDSETPQSQQRQAEVRPSPDSEVKDPPWNALLDSVEAPGQDSPFDLSAPVLAALRHMYRHYARRLSLEDLASRAGMSRFHLVRRFRAETGFTPYRYLVTLRVRRAQRLLVERPDLMVREVGAQVGYADPTAFARVFRFRAGVSPQSFRQQQLRQALSGPGDAGSMGLDSASPPTPDTAGPSRTEG